MSDQAVSAATRIEAPPPEPAPRKRRPRRQPMPREDMYRRWPLLKRLAAPPGTIPKDEECRAWEAAFTMRPDAMVGILQDIIKQAYAKPGRIGQRPLPREEEVDLKGLIFADHNDVALVDILPKLMKVSERAFCARIDMPRATFQRLMRGEYYPDIHELRRIAEAVKKPPVFFIEYRKMMAVISFVNLIDDRPGIATKLYRDYIEARV